MKNINKKAIVSWAIAALFFFSSLTFISSGNIGALITGLVLTGGLVYLGFYFQRKATTDSSIVDNTATNKEQNSKKEDAKRKIYVYVDKGGKKYHENKECSGMKNPQLVPIEKAKRQGKDACLKCATYKPPKY